MESKRLVLAIVFSCLLFLGWHFLSIEMGWVSTQPAPTNATTSDSFGSKAVPDESDPSAPAAPLVDSEKKVPDVLANGSVITVETPLYKAIFNSNGGVLQHFELLKYRKEVSNAEKYMDFISADAAKTGPLGLYVNGIPTWTKGEWRAEGSNLLLAHDETGLIRFIGTVDGMTVTRDLVFSGTDYTIGEKTFVSTPERKNISMAYTMGASSLALMDSPSIFQHAKNFLFGGPPPVVGESQHNITRVAWLQNGSFDEEASMENLRGENGQGKSIGANISWVGIMNNYFIGAIISTDTHSVTKADMQSNVFHVLVGRTSLSSTADAPAVMECSYYIGPKETTSLATAPGNLDKSLDYGWFTVIAKPLVSLLQFFYSYIGNYGVAIILMTVMIKLLLWPLSLKGYKSMEQMRKIQPLMQELRQKYANDREKMNQEMMGLYKRHKVNPAGGCLPIVVQIPVFFALYRVLLNAIELRHATFIEYLPFTSKPWLTDLAAQDPYLITPLVMGATMFIQQKLTPTPGDPTQAKIMMFMPIVFTALFITFPSGLVLYWLTNNVISIGQQWWQMKRSSRAE